MKQTNLVERMENLIACLSDIEQFVCEDSDSNTEREIIAAIGNAEGIAGEILTMIDGR